MAVGSVGSVLWNVPDDTIQIHLDVSRGYVKANQWGSVPRKHQIRLYFVTGSTLDRAVGDHRQSDHSYTMNGVDDVLIGVACSIVRLLATDRRTRHRGSAPDCQVGVAQPSRTLVGARPPRQSVISIFRERPDGFRSRTTTSRGEFELNADSLTKSASLDVGTVDEHILSVPIPRNKPVGFTIAEKPYLPTWHM